MKLRIATWNVERVSTWAQREGVSRLMAEQDADVWVLTETRADLAPGEEYQLVASSAPRPDGHADERWVAIWTRLGPDGDPHTTRDPEHSTAARIRTGGGETLTVYGTVLPWRGSSWRGHPSAGAVAFGAAVGCQAADWRDMLEECPNLCVAGDFNQDLSDSHYYWSRQAKQHLVEALSGSGITAVTSGPRDPVRQLTEQAAACIDHICLSASLASRLCEAPLAWNPVANGRRLSDHPGVMVTLVDV